MPRRFSIQNGRIQKRIADRILADKLETSGAVLIEGPKYCGKTTLASRQAQSILSMSDPDTQRQNLALARTNITQLLARKIDTTKMKKPSFLMVLTGIGEFAYKRPEDEVLVVPIGCLRD